MTAKQLHKGMCLMHNGQALRLESYVTRLPKRRSTLYYWWATTLFVQPETLMFAFPADRVYKELHSKV